MPYFEDACRITCNQTPHRLDWPAMDWLWLGSILFNDIMNIATGIGLQKLSLYQVCILAPCACEWYYYFDNHALYVNSYCCWWLMIIQGCLIDYALQECGYWRIYWMCIYWNRHVVSINYHSECTDYLLMTKRWYNICSRVGVTRAHWCVGSWNTSILLTVAKVVAFNYHLRWLVKCCQ
jgi:hypothetical protein